MKRWHVITALVLATIGVGLAILLVPPSTEPGGEKSAELYMTGPFGVIEAPLKLVDESRPTAANGEFPGAPARTLEGFLWTPRDGSGAPYPLVVYSHGVMSSAREARYYAEFLVPKGYIVAAVNYPLSNGWAPGGPSTRDVMNQPVDVTFIINSLLTRNSDAGDELAGQIDPDRIGVAGLSLGGLTSTLAGFHPELRDPRLRAIASVGGTTAFFSRRFYESTDAPFLMIAGTTDAIVPYGANAAPILDRDDNATLVSLAGGSHVGFAALAASVMRWVEHPDAIICPMLMSMLDSEGDAGAPLFEPDPDLGIVVPDASSAPCQDTELGKAMGPYDQLMLTRLALYAFFESVMASDTEVRDSMSEYLLETMARENTGVTVSVSDVGS